jgi:hypothetical protein
MGAEPITRRDPNRTTTQGWLNYIPNGYVDHDVVAVANIMAPPAYRIIGRWQTIVS